jgi:hypothetical protein
LANAFRENNQLKNMLKHMGYDVPSTTWAYGVKKQAAADDDPGWAGDVPMAVPMAQHVRREINASTASELLINW